MSMGHESKSHIRYRHKCSLEKKGTKETLIVQVLRVEWRYIENFYLKRLDLENEFLFI